MNIHKLLACTAVTWIGLLTTVDAMASDEPPVANEPEAAEVSGFVPPDDGYDWLQLVSGEWLKGELIGVFNDYVEFDSDILDDLIIDPEDVSRFHSPRTFGIRLRGKDPLSGQLRIDEQQVFVISDGEERLFSREQLIAVTASAERERDRWSGDLMLGINVRQGNTDFIEYNMMAGVERRTPRSRVFVDYLGSFNETEGERVANDHRINVVLDRFSGSRLFWRPLVGQYFRDPFQNIAHQITLETGLGYELIATRKTEWDIFAAAGANYVRRDSVEPGQPTESRSPAVSLGTDFDTELTSWMDYLFSFHMTFLDEESGTYQHHLVTTLSTDLVRNIDFDVSIVWDRTESPPPDALGIVPEKDDFRFMVGVSFEF